MDSVLSNPYILMAVGVTGTIGLAFCWFGVLTAALTALGNKRWIWGISTIILGPITGIPYTFAYKEADYPRSLMIKGLSLILLAGLLYLISSSFV